MPETDSKRSGGCIASEINNRYFFVLVLRCISVNAANSVVVLVIKIMYYIDVEISVEIYKSVFVRFYKRCRMEQLSRRKLVYGPAQVANRR